MWRGRMAVLRVEVIVVIVVAVVLRVLLVLVLGLVLVLELSVMLAVVVVVDGGQRAGGIVILGHLSCALKMRHRKERKPGCGGGDAVPASQTRPYFQQGRAKEARGTPPGTADPFV